MPSSKIELSSGILYDYNEGYDYKENIEDLIISSSNVCRFGGHMKQFNSLAQHGVLVSHMVEESGGTISDIQYALLHDGHEPFSGGDILTPLKSLLPDHKVIEENTQRMLLDCFGLKYEVPHIVKKYDLMAFMYELINKDGPYESPNYESIIDNLSGDYDYVYDYFTKQELVDTLQNYYYSPLLPEPAANLFRERYEELFVSEYILNKNDIDKYPYLNYNASINKFAQEYAINFINNFKQDFLSYNFGHKYG